MHGRVRGAIARFDGARLSFLTSRTFVRGRARFKTKVTAREMQPWFIDHTVGITSFKDDPSLSDKDIRRSPRGRMEDRVRGDTADPAGAASVRE